MRSLNKLYGGSGAKTTSLNPSGTPPGCGDNWKCHLPCHKCRNPSAPCSAYVLVLAIHPPCRTSHCPWASKRMVQLSPKLAAGHSGEKNLTFCGYRQHPLFLGNLRLNFQALWSAVFPSWPKYYSTCKDNRAIVTESTITIELLMIHEYTRTKYTFHSFCQEQDFLYLFYLGTLALWLPTVKHPNVEKNSSISFCRR